MQDRRDRAGGAAARSPGDGGVALPADEIPVASAQPGVVVEDGMGGVLYQDKTADGVKYLEGGARRPGLGRRGARGTGALRPRNPGRGAHTRFEVEKVYTSAARRVNEKRIHEKRIP